MTNVFLLLISIAFFSGAFPTDNEVYMFSFFQNNGADGLHLAYSEDGLNWEALNNNESFLIPKVGNDKLMRDPCIILGGDGKFHMVWTVSWNERGIGYANSTDLVRWSEQIYIPVMHHEEKALNCWAPELYFDAVEDQYLIYWATTIPGRFPDTDTSGDNGYNHRMYYTRTRDFIHFSETKLLYDPGFNVIDAVIKKNSGRYVMFLKDETLKPDPQKNIRFASSSELYGKYSPASAPITENWVEGPTAIETKEGWIVYFDMYTKNKMGAIHSNNLENWTDISDKIHFPKGTRHGTIFKVGRSILENLK